LSIFSDIVTKLTHFFQSFKQNSVYDRKTNLVVASLYIMVFSRKCHELRCQWFLTCLFQMERL